MEVKTMNIFVIRSAALVFNQTLQSLKQEFPDSRITVLAPHSMEQAVGQTPLVDEVIPEPLGGAHKGPDEVATRIADCLERQLDELEQKTTVQLLEERYRRLLSFGEFEG